MYRPGAASSRERFLDQFERDGDGYVYRHRQTGPAYRVTADEKDDFVATFDRQRKRARWVVAAIFGGLFVGLVLVTQSSSWVLLWPTFYLLMIVPELVIDHVTFRVPARALVHRTPVAPALSRAERQRLSLERLPLTVVVGTATITICVLLFFALERPAIDWPKLLVIAACIAALAWALVQGVRKWQLERTYAASNLI